MSHALAGRFNHWTTREVPEILIFLKLCTDPKGLTELCLTQELIKMSEEIWLISLNSKSQVSTPDGY